MKSLTHYGLLRRALGIESQAEVAKELGVHTVSIARWEAGMRAPDRETRKRLAQALLTLCKKPSLTRKPGRRRLEQLLYVAILSEPEHAELPAAEWGDLLDFDPGLLRGVPPVREVSNVPLYSGRDVGVALQAALHRQSVRAYCEEFGRDATIRGLFRVNSEIQRACFELAETPPSRAA